MREILPGVFHWTRVHPRIHVPVSSYWLRSERVLIDPLIPDAGLDAFAEAPPEHVLLTNRHHLRDSVAIRERFSDLTLWCVEHGLHEFTGGEAVRGFAFGDRLPGGVDAVEIGVLCPDEAALFVPQHRALAVADGVVREGEGPLGFVPDEYLGDEAESVKRALRDAYRPVLELDFDHLLPAHGAPWIGGAKEALAAFTEG